MENEGGAYFSGPVKLTAEQESEFERYQRELADSWANCQEALPPEAYEENIEPVAAELNENLNRMTEAEAQFGAQPEVAAQYAPKHEDIKEKVQEAVATYKSDKPEEEKEASAKAVGNSMMAANEFLMEQLLKILESDNQMKLEAKEIRKAMAEMMDDTRSHSPEEMNNAIFLGMRFQRDVDAIRRDAKEQKTPATAQLYQAAKATVHEVYTDIKEMPGRIKEAIKNKAYNVVDAGIRKVAGIFDRGISILETKKAEFLNLSPLEKERGEKENTTAQAKAPEEKQAENAQAVPTPPAVDVPLPNEAPSKPSKAVEQKISLDKEPKATVVEETVSLKDLMKGDPKVIKKMLDYMAKNGAKESDISQAITKIHATATTMLKTPEYDHTRANAVTAQR